MRWNAGRDQIRLKPRSVVTHFDRVRTGSRMRCRLLRSEEEINACIERSHTRWRDQSIMSRGRGVKVFARAAQNGIRVVKAGNRYTVDGRGKMESEIPAGGLKTTKRGGVQERGRRSRFVSNGGYPSKTAPNVSITRRETHQFMRN